MRETRDLLAAIDAAKQAGEEMALATVVHIEGSTYRRPGARMLVPASGMRVGTVSGGCLEDDVSRIAQQVISENRPRMARFDLTAEDDALWGYGLGCNGLIDLFLEPTESVLELGHVFRQVIDGGRSGGLVTVLDSDLARVTVGSRLLVPDDSPAEGSLGLATEAAMKIAAEARSERRSLVRQLAVGAGSVRLFAEPLDAPIQLVVCGAGDDAVPLARYADDLGWSVSVSDPRRPLLTRRRFPTATRVVSAAANAFRDLELGGRTAVVVMSHNFLRDAEYLRGILGSPVFYIGLLGPRQRSERLFDHLAAERVRPTVEDLAKLHAPAGLDIGAEGPQQIAWAILAEILAAVNGRPGGPLRVRVAPIHAEASPTENRESGLVGARFAEHAACNPGTEAETPR